MVEKELVFTEKKVYWWRIIIGVGLCLTVIVLLSFEVWSIFGQKEVSPVYEDKDPSTENTQHAKKRRTMDNYPPSSYFPKTLSIRFPNADYEIRTTNKEDPRGVTAKAYASMDRDTGELLVSKNLTEQLPIASVVKVMTVLVAIDGAPADKEIIVSDESTRIGEASMGLTKGERLTVEELLYGVMLPSGNDAAETLAEGVFLKKQPYIGETQSRQIARTTFLAAMNKKADDLGMYDTFFSNPTGLDETTIEQTSYSTVLDLLALGNYAVGNKRFTKIVSTKQMTFPYRSGYHKAFYLFNILDLAKSYPGIKGIKPGETGFAKETLLSYAENGGKRIILAILGSDATKDDAVKIYDYIFNNLGVKIKRNK